jgi:hypothetical protein
MAIVITVKTGIQGSNKSRPIWIPAAQLQTDVS